MVTVGMRRKARAAGLTFAACLSGTAFASCTAADISHNLIAGTLAFVKGYATDFWGVLLPDATEVLEPEAAAE